jgi:hypothetical protein
MLQPSVSSQRVGRDGAAQLRLVRRYARILRETTTETATSRVGPLRPTMSPEEPIMAKDHGSSVKNDKQYEGLRDKGMSKERAAKIANTPNASSKGGKNSHSGGSSQSSKSSGSGSGGNRKQKQEAGRKGGKASS